MYGACGEGGGVVIGINAFDTVYIHKTKLRL